jgi:hypothetical protein
MPKKTELERLFPEQIVTTDKGDVIMSPLRIQNFPGVIRMIRRYFPSETGEIFLDFNKLLELLAEDQSAQDVTWLLSISTDKDPDWLLEVSGEDYLNLLQTWWEINKDFFQKKVLPLFQEITGGKLVDGSALSKSLLPADTATPISETTPPTSLSFSLEK